MTTPEGAIKKQICDWLAYQKCFFWIQQAGKIPGRINKSKYLRNGISDILGVWNGRMLAIEVKAPGNKPSSDQTEFINAVNASGGIAFVAYSLEQVIEEIKGRVG